MLTLGCFMAYRGKRGLGIVDHLRGRPPRLDQCAYLLQTCGKRVNLLLLECDDRFLFLYVTPLFLVLAVLFEEFIEQHDAVILVYDEAGNANKTREHAGDFREP